MRERSTAKSPATQRGRKRFDPDELPPCPVCGRLIAVTKLPASCWWVGHQDGIDHTVEAGGATMGKAMKAWLSLVRRIKEGGKDV